MAVRLLYINQNFVNNNQSGNTRPVRILSTFLNRGFKVDVLTGLTGYLDDIRQSSTDTPVIEKDGQLTVHRLAVSCRKSQLHNRSLSYLRFLTKAIQYLPRIKKIDVIYATSPPLPQVILSVLASWWRKVPLIFEIRDIWPAFLVENGLLRSRLLIKAMEWIEAFMYRYADYCIPVSPPFAAYLTELGVPENRITTIPTGGDPVYSQMNPAEGTYWRKEHALNGKFIVIYTGSFHQYYNLELVLRAAEELAESRPDIHWVFAGNGRDRLKIQHAADQYDTIHYLGLIPKKEMYRLYLAADVGLVTLAPLPLMQTVIPGKLFDYLASGTPVLSLVGGQTGAIIKAANAGVVLERPEKQGIIRSILQMADMPDSARREQGTQGQLWVLKHMNSVQMAHKAVEIVQRTLDKRGRFKRLLRILSSGAGAWRDVTAGRSNKALQKLFGPKCPKTIQRSFQEWLEKTGC